MAYKIHKPARTVGDQVYVVEAAKGLGVTFSRLFTNLFSAEENKKIATIRYPDETRDYPERFRGVHRLTHRTDGSPRCVACLCCSTACPAQCIHIEPAEYEPGDARYGYERFPKAFVIDELRCIFCGFCVEACPCDAIRMDTGLHAVPYDSRDQFIYEKDLLLDLAARDGGHESANPRHEPGDPTHPGVSRLQAH